MKKRHWLVILIGMILMIGLIGPGRAEEQLPPEIKSALAGMEITQTAYWDKPGSTWFVLIRTPEELNALLCFELHDGTWIQSFHTSTAVPQGKTGVEHLHVTDKLRDFVDDRILPGPILLMMTDDGGYTSHQRSASGQWNLLKVFWIDEQVHLNFDDESVIFITPIDQDNNRFETVEGSFERDLRKVDINAIPRTPRQAQEMLKNMHSQSENDNQP